MVRRRRAVGTRLPPMARLRRFDLEELSARPGTYFNPETEILIVVDDSAHPGAEKPEPEPAVQERGGH